MDPLVVKLFYVTGPLPGNLLQSCCTASFMLYLMQTRPKNELEYMQDILYRTLVSDETPIR